MELCSYKVFLPLLYLLDTYNALVNSLFFSVQVINEESKVNRPDLQLLLSLTTYLDELLFLNK